MTRRVATAGANVREHMLELLRVPGRERRIVLAIAAGIVLLRSAIFVLYEGTHFNSDQAIFGLMAKHLSELRAFPVFPYGQHYMLGVEAWAAVPFFLIGGPTVTMLKMPLLLMNIAVVTLLITSFQKETGLRPAWGAVAAVFVMLPPPGTTTLLLEAGGANVEPLLWVLLLWVTRHRPVAFGGLFAIGFLNREFTAYGLAALLLLKAIDGSLFTRRRMQDALLALVSFTAVWQVVGLLSLPRLQARETQLEIETAPTPCGLMTLSKTAINPREKGAEMSSVLRPVRKRKKGRKLGRVEVIRREDYTALELDAKVELIRSLVPLGLMHVEEVLDEEVTALAGERYARKAASIGGRRHGSNPGTVGLAGQRVPIRVPRVRGAGDSVARLRGVAWRRRGE